MADTKKEELKPFFTTEKVTMYAPENAPHHTAGEKTEVQALQKDKFLKMGYTTEPVEFKKKSAKNAEGGEKKEEKDPK